jgi:hypothetical protein
MRKCLYCQEKLRFMMRLRGEAFCSHVHESAFYALVRQPLLSRAEPVVIDVSPVAREASPASFAQAARPVVFTVSSSPQHGGIPKIRLRVKITQPDWLSRLRSYPANRPTGTSTPNRHDRAAEG